MSWRTLLPLIATACIAAAETPAATHTAPFGQIRAPQVAVVGKAYKIQVLLKAPLADARMVGVHLHWMKAEGGFGGVVSTAGAQPAVAGKPISFELDVKDTPGAGTVYALVYLSKDGEWKDDVTKFACPGVPIKAK